MSQYSRSAKPTADLTIPEEEIFAVDKEEVGFTNGVAAPGWVRRRSIGDTRIVHETLVAMVTPPTDEDFEDDDTAFPNVARTLAVDELRIEYLDDDGETWTTADLEEDPGNFTTFVTARFPAGTLIRISGETTPTPSLDDTSLYKFYIVTDYSGEQDEWSGQWMGYSFRSETAWGTTRVYPIDTADWADFLYPGEGEVEGEVEFALASKSVLGAVPTPSPYVGGFGLAIETPALTIDSLTPAPTVAAGVEVDLTVAATISPAYLYTLAYQWYQVGTPDTALVDGLVFSGTDTDTLVIADADGLDGAEFYCVVTATGPMTIAPVQTADILVTVTP